MQYYIIAIQDYLFHLNNNYKLSSFRKTMDEGVEPFAHWDKPSWDEYFMSMALLVSTRSMDGSNKQGCVIVGKDKKVLSLGYNGPPKGSLDKEIPLTERPYKYLLMEHAELNALHNRQFAIEGSTLYVTSMPCVNCLRSVLQAGVSRVVHGPFKSRAISTIDEEAMEMMMRGRDNTFKIEEFQGQMLKCIDRAKDYYNIKSEIVRKRNEEENKDSDKLKQ